MPPPDVRSGFTVRSYEIDSYGHLNNGVYLGWFEQGRLDFLTSLGFSYEGFARRGEWLVVARTAVDFRRPLRVGESVQVTTRLESLGRTSVRFRQVMRLAGSEGAPVVASEAATIMVFSGSDGAIPIPADFRSAAGA